MTVIGVQPIVLKDVQLLIDADDYAAHVSEVIFNPSQGTVSWKGLSPAAKFTATQDQEWTAQLSYAQDWVTANSLSRYLFDHAGETKACKFQPKKGTGMPEITADLVLAAGPIGGAVDQVATGQVTCGVDGKPVIGVAA